MAKGFSFAIVEGGLGRDCESKALPSGAKVVNFSLGYERGFKDKAHTCWMNVVAFGAQAEFAEKYLSKGKSVRVSGEIDVRSYDDKQTGAKRYVTELIADKIQFVDDRSSASATTQTATRQERATPVRQQAAPVARVANDNPFDDGDDIPF